MHAGGGMSARGPSNGKQDFHFDCTTSLERFRGYRLKAGESGGFVLMEIKNPVKVVLLDSGKQFIGGK